MDHEAWADAQKTVSVDTALHRFEVAYRDVGTGGPVTLFLHGIPTWGYLYRDAVDAVEHAVVADLPGYGYTRHASGTGFDRSVRAQTDYVRGFLAQLGVDSAQVVAHDIGGAVALRLAITTDLVDRLVLSQATCYDSFPVDFIMDYGSPARARNMTYRDVERELTELFRGGLRDPETAADFVEGMVAPFLDPAVDPDRLSRNAVATDTNHTLELVPYHDEVTAPTLLLWGTPGSGQHAGYARRLAADLPDARTEFVSGAGHWLMRDRPTPYVEGLAAFLD